MKTINQLLSKEKDITAWLNKMDIDNYTLVANKQYGFVVNVQGNVILSEKKLKAIPVKFNRVQGYFHCDLNQLKILQGCPSFVGAGFRCRDNQLTSLVDGPVKVGENYDCDRNNLTSLTGAPKHIKGYFSCMDNALTDLQFCPLEIEEEFFCTNNNLQNLEYCPKKVTGQIFLRRNPQLGPYQQLNNFDDVYKIHQEFVRIKGEKKLLGEAIVAGFTTTLKSYKI